jgi:hypothetical protein
MRRGLFLPLPVLVKEMVLLVLRGFHVDLPFVELLINVPERNEEQRVVKLQAARDLLVPVRPITNFFDVHHDSSLFVCS